MNALEAHSCTNAAAIAANEGPRARSTTPPEARPRFDLAETVHCHGAALYRLALRLTGDRDAACDLLHDTYERALRRALPEQAERNAISWLKVIMRNLYFDRWRARQRRPEVALHDAMEPTGAHDPEEDAEPAWRRLSVDQVRGCVARLQPSLRTVYELHAFGGKSYLEIASSLRVPSGTVGTRLLRARQQLKQALTQEMALS